MDEKMNLFLASIDEKNRPFVEELNEYLTKEYCVYDIKSAKSGYVLTYLWEDTKKALATFVFRKSGIKLRIYPAYIHLYQDFLNTLPEKFKKDIKKASVCKRLINPDDCNPRCVKGYAFKLDGEIYQKCRYMAFMPIVNEENNPYIRQLLDMEIKYRK